MQCPAKRQRAAAPRRRRSARLDPGQAAPVAQLEQCGPRLRWRQVRKEALHLRSSLRAASIEFGLWVGHLCWAGRLGLGRGREGPAGPGELNGPWDAGRSLERAQLEASADLACLSSSLALGSASSPWALTCREAIG